MVKCPKGKISRDAYWRHGYTRSDGTIVKPTFVPATCVPDKGKPGKTPISKRVLPKPTKGALSKYGYYNLKTTNAVNRRKALTRAVKAESYATIVRRVNLIANFNKLSEPVTHRIMRSDIAWMQTHLAPKKASKRASMPSANLIKRGRVEIKGRMRQVYHLRGSNSKFYRYRAKDGTIKRRYI